MKAQTKEVLSRLNRLNRKIIYKFRGMMHLNDSESKLASDSHKYWNQNYMEKPKLAQDAHWNNKGIFEDQQRWYSLGEEHLNLIKEYSELADIQLPVKQIVEWGCGGGANAIHFAPLADRFIGIDINQGNLDECNKQVINSGLNNFQPVLINAISPQSVLDFQIKEVNLFICTYVYELLPSKAYGLTVLKLANMILKEGGVAFIQIRYNDGKNELKSKPFAYKSNPYHMTTYSIEEFWEESKKLGFLPKGIFLKPIQPLVNDGKYAYFFLKKTFNYKSLEL